MYLLFRNLSIFFISLIFNHLYSHVKLHTYRSHSILMSNYIFVVLTSRSVTANAWVTAPEDSLCVVNNQPVGNPKRKV
jgi:hypothetical protein